jgi:dTDP-4-dehydrorhamnose reductase
MCFEETRETVQIQNKREDEMQLYSDRVISVSKQNTIIFTLLNLARRKTQYQLSKLGKKTKLNAVHAVYNEKNWKETSRLICDTHNENWANSR